MIQRGDIVVCTDDEWFNAYGDRHVSMRRDIPARVTEIYVISGVKFLEFEEFPGQKFWIAGFRKSALN